MKKTVATAAAAAALTTGGVALANGGGPIGDVLGIGEDSQQELASDLAAELGGGITAADVSGALEAVREDHEAERRAALAAALAAELDGVSAEQIEAALARQEEAMGEAFESGEEPPEPGSFIENLAADLGVSEDELEDAFAATHERMAEEHRAELEQRLDQAVEDGAISEERADEIRRHLEQGPEIRFAGPGHAPPPARPGSELHIGPGFAAPSFGPAFGERF